MANISRDIYDEALSYLKYTSQQGTPVVDADLNDSEDIRLQLFRRLIRDTFGDGSPLGNVGFKLKGTGSANDVTFEGNGAGSVVDRGVHYVGGLPALLINDVTYKGLPNGSGGVGGDEIHGKSTGLTDTVLTDNTADWTFGTGTANLLVGLKLVPDISDGTGFTITANTANTITADPGMVGVASAQDFYRIEMSTPGGARTDDVYLDVWIREVDSNEDTTLLHNLGTSIEAFIRDKAEKRIYIDQGQQAASSWKNTEKDEKAFRWVDTSGDEHFVIKIGQIARVGAQDAINVSETTDKRISRFGNSFDTITRRAESTAGNDIANAASLQLVHNLEMDLAVLEVVAFFKSGGEWVRIDDFSGSGYTIQAVSGNTKNAIEIVNNTGGAKELLLHAFPSGSPKQQSQSFVSQKIVEVVHNLGKIPKIIIIINNTEPVEPKTLNYHSSASPGVLSKQNFIFTFNNPTTGTVYFE